ncbi:MAG: hypothetical protein HZB70_00135 [Candidatus Berkelbacteria bacterium]|nr:MAG: hypothetical protein HZB70_00135 [Candidatus Berkelbacteria bacterium]QQG51478.1 MAG: hypothetical protein HY845_02865 [Candidatus Berkelbacteria bacterium]
METIQPNYDTIKIGRHDRLVDRYAESEVHALESKGQNCVIAVTVEIDNPWHHAREYGRQIITALVREFVRAESSSNLIRFEQSLKATNSIIKQAKEKLNVPVNCVVALLINEEVHFAVAGNNKLLLWRNGDVTDATSGGLETEEQFSSVTSGDLNEGEWLMLANKPLSHFLENNEQEIWSDDDSEAISAAIVELSPVGERESFTGILLRYAPGKLHRELSVMWDTLEHLTPIKLPRFKFPNLPLSDTAAVVAGSSRASWEFVKKLISKIKERGSKRAENSSFDLGSNGFKLPRLSLPKFNIRSRIQIIAAVILVALIIVGVRTIVSRVNSTKEEQKAPNLAEQLVATPVGQRILFLNDRFSLEEYNALSGDQKQTFAQALAAESVSPLILNDLVSELETPVKAIDSLNDVLAVVDTSGQVWLIKEGQAIKVEQTVKIADPISIAIVAEDRILVSDKTGNIWLLDATPSQPLTLPLQAAVSSGPKLLQKFNRNVYVYHQASNTIYRQVNFDKDLNGLKALLKDDLLTLALADFAINGRVVALDVNGKVSSFAAGKLESQQLTVPVQEGAHLTSVETNSKIFVLSGGVLYIADDKGVLQQSIFPLVDSVEDIVLDGSGKTLWLATGKKIYRFTI